MQLGSRIKPRTNRNLIIKIILFLLVFFLGIFLLDKIDFPHQKNLSNKKLAMISLSHLNKLIILVNFFYSFNSLIILICRRRTRLLIYGKKKKIKMRQNNQTDSEKDITIESPILSEDINKIVIKIDEDDN